MIPNSSATLSFRTHIDIDYQTINVSVEIILDLSRALNLNIMNKSILYFLFLSIGLSSCTSDPDETPAVEDQIVQKGERYELDLVNSQVRWFADYIKQGVVDHSHHGQISFTNGSLGLENGVIQWGEFELDMNSFYELEEGSETRKLISHLRSEDFFHTEKYPRSKVMITQMGENEIRGTITIKDIEMPIRVPINLNLNNNVLHINGVFDLDLAPFRMSGFEGTEAYVSSKVRFRINLELKKP